MTKRTLPKSDLYASCPYDEKILDYYKGQFDAVFILLHPFINPINIDIDNFCPGKWPSKHEIIEDCESVSWEEILKTTNLNNISEIDIGLRGNIGGIKKESSNKNFETTLCKLTEKNNIILPPEGELPPLLENRILNAIKSIGYEWLWLGDEFGTERKLHWIDDLIDKDSIPSHGCLFTPDHSLLVATHWDSHCSFLCSSEEVILKILEVGKFEGFYCNENTEVYWGLYEKQP